MLVDRQVYKMWRGGSTRGRAPGRCSKCTRPVKDHPGPYGPRCKNPLQSSTSAFLEAGSYSEPRQGEERRREAEKRREDRREERREEREDEGDQTEGRREGDYEGAEGGDNRETDKTVNMTDETEKSEDVELELKDVIKGLAKQVSNLQVQVNELNKKQEVVQRTPARVYNNTSNTNNTEGMNWDGAGIEQECLSMPRLMRQNHSSPADIRNDRDERVYENGLPGDRPERVPGLRPVGERGDLARYCPVPGISENALKDALSGKFVQLETFLIDYNSDASDVNKPMELSAQPDGRVMYKPKRRKRAVYNFSTWLEAWMNYSRTMINYHGIAVSENMLKYVKHIQDYDRKHPWRLVDTVDVQNRIDHGGRDIEFSRIDVMLLFSNFDRGSNSNQSGSWNSSNQASQPFQGNPGRQAGSGTRGGSYAGSYDSSSGSNAASRGGQKDRFISDEPCDNWNDSRCYTSSCRRSHTCRGCGGNLPFSLCVRFARCSGRAEQAQPWAQQGN